MLRLSILKPLGPKHSVGFPVCEGPCTSKIRPRLEALARIQDPLSFGQAPSPQSVDWLRGNLGATLLGRIRQEG